MRTVQQVEQLKNAEYQTLIAELEASKQQANNALIAVKREADKYFIERSANGSAERDEKVTRAKANEVAYQKSAEGLVAEIQAVGAAGPDVLNREIYDELVPVTDEEAIETSRQLSRREGIFVGISAGGTLAAGLKVAQKADPGSVMLVMLPDTGERYLSTPLFEGIDESSDDDWLAEVEAASD